MLNMLLAGEDDTASTVAWMIHLLWLNPAKLALATEEVQCVLGDYVDACARETMRLKPPAPQLGLQAIRDTTLGDVHVPAGMMVLSLIRRDSVSEALVPRAAAFEPERWLVDDNENSGAKRASMPFGAGPRMCRALSRPARDEVDDGGPAGRLRPAERRSSRRSGGE